KIKLNQMKTLINKSLILIMLIGGVFTACKDDMNGSVNLTADVNIQSFKIGDAKGLVNNEKGTITVLVPVGTDLSAVAPEITLPAGAKVNPASGVAQNFTFSANTPISYQVFNGDVYT